MFQTATTNALTLFPTFTLSPFLYAGGEGSRMGVRSAGAVSSLGSSGLRVLLGTWIRDCKSLKRSSTLSLGMGFPCQLSRSSISTKEEELKKVWIKLRKGKDVQWHDNYHEKPHSLLSPLPLKVFATMQVGLPLTCWACQKALHSSSTSWPSTTYVFHLHKQGTSLTQSHMLHQILTKKGVY